MKKSFPETDQNTVSSMASLLPRKCEGFKNQLKMWSLHFFNGFVEEKGH